MKFVRKPYQHLWKNPIWPSLASLLLAYAAVELLHVSILIMTLPVVAISFQSQRFYQERVFEKNRLLQEISRLQRSTIECLARTINAKDQTTHAHLRRVQVYAVELAKKAGLSDNEINGLRAAALLHDIGKLGIPEAILNKPGKLTRQEYSRMKLHTTIGAEILCHVDFPYPVVPAIRYHHERFDGQGYPEGLRGEEIPLSARVLALADFYDALCSDRPYRRALSKREVLKIIRSEKGKIFDPRLADLFCRHVTEFESYLDQEPTKEPKGIHTLLSGAVEAIGNQAAA